MGCFFLLVTPRLRDSALLPQWFVALGLRSHQAEKPMSFAWSAGTSELFATLHVTHWGTRFSKVTYVFRVLNSTASFILHCDDIGAQPYP